MKDLTSKVAIVTGAGSGIGRAIAIALSGAGANVVLVGRDRTKLEETLNSFPKSAHNLILPTDITKEQQVKDLFFEVRKTLGKVDILINNAANFGLTKETVDLNRSDLDEVFNVNVMGTFMMMCEALKIMREQKSGYILNISTALAQAQFAYTMRLPYVASKMAIEGMTKVAAGENTTKGIIINALAPGHIEGERINEVMVARAKSTGRLFEAVKKGFEKQYPLGILHPEEVAETIIALLTTPFGYKNTGITYPLSAGFRLT